MAFRHISDVVESWLPPAEKLVALAIAESAGRDDNQCWLSMDRIAQRASCTVRGAQAAIRRLEEAGIVRRVGKRPVPRGFVWIFELHVECLPMRQPGRGEPDSPVVDIPLVTVPTGARRSPVEGGATGEPAAPLRGERDDTTGERGAGVRVNGGPSRGEPGSGNPIRMNQSSEPVHRRDAPGQSPGRTPEQVREERELIVDNNSARNLGVPPMQPGETVQAFRRRLGEAQLKRLIAGATQ